MGSTRVLIGQRATLEHVFYDDEDAVDADDGVTVTIARADGTAIVTDAVAELVSTDTGTYRYRLGAQSELNRLAVSWTGTLDGAARTETDYVEVVGGFYVGLADLRGLADGERSGARFATEDLKAARAWFEDHWERYTGRSWVPRFARETVDGGWGSLLLRHYPVRSVLSVQVRLLAATGWTAFTTDELGELVPTQGGGVLRAAGVFPAGVDNVLVEYTHGYDQPTEDIRQVALVAIKARLLDNFAGSRQLSVATGEGIVRQSYPGPDRPFGIPFCDQLANRYRRTGAIA